MFKNDKTRCIPDNLLVSNCVSYNEKVECIRCKSGFIVSLNTLVVPAFVCKAIDPNCEIYNQMTNSCDQCVEGAVKEGLDKRVCVFPEYGIDQNCVLYVNKLCERCRDGWVKVGHVCSKQEG